MSALPCPQAFVDPTVGVVGCLGAGVLLFHAFHPGTERIFARPTFRLRGFQSGLAGVGLVVGRTTLGI